MSEQIRHQYLRPRRLAPLACATLLLAACGGGGGGGDGGRSGLNGIAAVGAAIVGGAVQAKCANGQTYDAAGDTSNAGIWNMASVPASAPPCAIRVSGGKIGSDTGDDAPDLYSYAAAPGRVNITTLTNLAIAHAAGAAPAVWYGSFGSGDRLPDSALSGALDALAGKGYHDNPLTVDFNADGTGHDALLDAIGAALDADAYAALVTSAAEGDLDTLPEADTGTPDPETPANLAVLTQFAGTYSASGTATVSGRDGTANRSHQRGSIIIGNDGSVDFDTGISFTAGQINAIYDRTSLQQPVRRVHVNYDTTDSGRKLQLWLDNDNQITEISYSNGAGELTRAAIGTGQEPEEPIGPGESVLGNSNGVTGLFNGERRTDLRVVSYAAPPLKVSQGYARIGDNGSPSTNAFQVYLSGFFTTASQINAAQSCKDNGAPGLNVTIDGTTYYSMSSVGGSCQIKVLAVDGDAIRVSFSGTLGSFGTEDVLTIADGEFQYIAQTFPANTRVTASFEGLGTGSVNGKGNGTGDSGWAGTWSGFLNLADTSASPLSFTPSGGSGLSGGNTALEIQTNSGIGMEGRLLDKTFNGDVYVSTLVRINGDTTLSNSWLVLPWGTFGINTNGQETDQFHFNNQRFGGQVASNTTYLLVARLSKTGSSPTYNRADVWVNPGVSDSAAPQHSTSVTGSPTGSAYRFYNLGFQSSQQLRPLLIDRIRITDTWDGVFAQ